MGLYVDHLLDSDTYPYITVAEFLTGCEAAAGRSETDDDVLDAIEDASLVLYYLTGKQFRGTTRTTVRPCLPNLCACNGGCTPNRINLGLWPVTSIVSVRYEGTLYASEQWHVDEYRYIVRHDGDLLFESQNPYAIAGGSEDTDDDPVFEVTVDHGMSLPRLMKRATRALACELLSATAGGPCRLPERVTSVSRQGITMDTASAQDFLQQGRTGIYAVDLAIEVFNPKRLQSASFVWSPDLSTGRRVNT